MRKWYDDPRRVAVSHLIDVSRQLKTYFDQRAREYGGTRAQWGVLIRLDREEGQTQADLAETLELQPISLLRLIDKLCEQGLVERRSDPRDRRVNRLYITNNGRETLKQVFVVGDAIMDELFAGTGQGEILRLIEGLLKLKENVKSAAQHHEPSEPRRESHARG